MEVIYRAKSRLENCCYRISKFLEPFCSFLNLTSKYFLWLEQVFMQAPTTLQLFPSPVVEAADDEVFTATEYI